MQNPKSIWDHCYNTLLLGSFSRLHIEVEDVFHIEKCLQEKVFKRSVGAVTVDFDSLALLAMSIYHHPK